MEFMDLLLILAVWGVIATAVCAVLAFLLHRKQRAPEPKPPQLTLSAEDLLHDLTTRGVAVLRVEVIDPTNLLLRSPRR